MNINYEFRLHHATVIIEQLSYSLIPSDARNNVELEEKTTIHLVEILFFLDVLTANALNSAILPFDLTKSNFTECEHFYAVQN